MLLDSRSSTKVLIVILLTFRQKLVSHCVPLVLRSHWPLLLARLQLQQRVSRSQMQVVQHWSTSHIPMVVHWTVALTTSQRRYLMVLLGMPTSNQVSSTTRWPLLRRSIQRLLTLMTSRQTSLFKTTEIPKSSTSQTLHYSLVLVVLTSWVVIISQVILLIS